MSVPQWRQFQFFDSEQIQDEQAQLLAALNFTAVTAGRGHLFLADQNGDLHLLDRSLTEICAWNALTRVASGRITQLKQLKQKNILLAVVEEDAIVTKSNDISGHSAHVQIWNLDKILAAAIKSNPHSPGSAKESTSSPSLPQPTLVRSIPIQRSFPVTAFCVLEDLTQVCVGFADGAVVLLRGDVTRDRTVKQTTIRDGGDPVTGLGFRGQKKQISLFVATTEKIWIYDTSATRESKTLLDDVGCELQRATMSESSQELVVARDEAIYFYGSDSRGQCFAYDGPKTSISWYKNYLLITSPLPTAHLPANLQAPGGGKRMIGHSHVRSHTAPLEEVRLSLFDTVNKFIAFNATFVGGFKAIMCEWGSIIVVSGDGRVYKLDEKDSATKLDMLFKRNLYFLAINLAHASGYDNARIADIFKKYGDHLYGKADYDTAMTQYLLTIGHLEPSYVIRKYLDAQRIRALTAYLQKLHEAGLANTDHTTLLLNCYTKLKDVARLDSFIKADEMSGTTETSMQESGGSLPPKSTPSFDVETAIKVCRQAGYHSHALYLAFKFLEHEMYLKIQIEDVKDYGEALLYLRGLGASEASKGLLKYGKTLLANVPLQTTNLLVELCTGQLAASSSDIMSPRSQIAFEKSTSIRSFIPLFVDAQPWLEQFIEKVSEKRWNRCPGRPSAPEFGAESSSIKSNVTGKSSVAENIYKPPQKDSDEDGEELEERRFAWLTLLELYLTPDPDGARGTLESSDHKSKLKPPARKEKALWILKDTSTPLDSSQTLLLCHLANFDEGVRHLQEETGMYEDLVRGWMNRGDSAKVVEAIEKFGPKEPALYSLALTYFNKALASTPASAEKEQHALLQRVLDHIDEQGILPPMQVVQALAGSTGGPAATIGGVKDYLLRRVKREKSALEENRQLIRSYREETEKKRDEIEELKSSARIFQVTKCSGCQTTLDLPAVHFLCRHSYHQRCLPLESEKECPRCSPEDKLVLELQRSQEDNVGRHDLFTSQLEDADDGFDLIAEYFGKNVLGFTKIID